MSLETDLVAVIEPECPDIWADFAPFDNTKPYVIYQGVGGESWRYVDNTAADKRHTLMQITVWSNSRVTTNNLVRAIEDALCAATQFTARPDAEPTSIAEEDLGLYGAQQDFVIVSPR